MCTPANRGRTHGSWERMRSDGIVTTYYHSLVLSRAIDTNFYSCILAIASTVPGVSNVQQAPDWLVPVATCPLQLVEQLAFGPRRLASRVSVDQEHQRNRIAERAAPPEPAADAGSVDIPLLFPPRR